MADARTAPAEFDCWECRRHIVAVCGGLPAPPIWAMCTHIPGWFKVPKLRQILDPTHDGRDPAYPPELHHV